MSGRHLESLLAPRSVALIGASDRPQSIGATVMRNLLSGGFAGPIWAVNRQHAQVAGRPAYASVADLSDPPDLAVICTPASTVPGLIEELGRRGTRAAVVITAGLQSQALLSACGRSGLRLLGPNCLGLLVPRIGLNASFSHAPARPGRLALIAQSGALLTAMLDWANAREVGFSALVSLGNAVDVDLADLLDYFCLDPHTDAILLYVESITHARKFMSAGRSAARNKPVIVVKAGRRAESAQAVVSHTGALAGVDEVYDAAFRRAGMLRVDTTRELVDAAVSLGKMKPLQGERLAIVSNGGGPAILAADALIQGGGKLAALSQRTLAQLNEALPANWSHANPIDIIGDAPARRYAATVRCTTADSSIDATLLIHAPTAIVSPGSIARECCTVMSESPRAVLTCWMGGRSVDDAKSVCATAGIPTYSTPEEAVSAFLHVVDYTRNQRQLMEVPAAIPLPPVQLQRAREIVARAVSKQISVLTEVDSKQLLETFGIPVVPTRVVADAASAGRAAEEIGFPVVLKILSPDISHKSDLGGVALDIDTAARVHEEAERMVTRIRSVRPEARLEGFTVQPMIRRPHARELIAGITVERVFGPVILFGQGGVDVEVVADQALALPPLNSVLAAEVIGRTRVRRRLDAYRDRPAADLQTIEGVLIRLGQMVIDLPQIVELDINPLLADEHGVVALDARIRVYPVPGTGLERLAIRPYPTELEEWVDVASQRVLLRPIRPEDYAQHQEFLTHVSPGDLQRRFFHYVHELSGSQLASLTQIDYERSMAFIAEASTATVPTDTESVDEPPRQQTLGVARVHCDADGEVGEFAILVRTDCQRRGLGSILLRKVIRYARDRGLARIRGDVLPDNQPMLRLAARLGFRRQGSENGLVKLVLDVQ